MPAPRLLRQVPCFGSKELRAVGPPDEIDSMDRNGPKAKRRSLEERVGIPLLVASPCY